MKKKEEKPIKIQTYDDLKTIIGYHPCQKIEFTCENCHNVFTKSLSALKKRGCLCQKCQRTINGIAKYGTAEDFKEHLKEVKKKADKTLIEKHGSKENAIKKQIEATKKTCLERYGVDNFSKTKQQIEKMKTNNPIHLEGVIEKIKKAYTKEKHLVASQKVSEYMHENDLYGLRSLKCAQTKLERYGNSGYNNQEKQTKTFLEKYGCKCGLNIALKKKEKEIIDNGLIKLSDLSDMYDYYEEGLFSFFQENNIEIVKIGKWRCVRSNDIPDNINVLLFKQLHKQRSNGEKEMFNFIQTLVDNVIPNDRKVIYPKEIDIFIPSYNLGIEFNGLFWHKNDNILIKTEKCNNLGIRLMHFYEDEWYFKQDICKSLIKSALNIYDQRIYARKCVLKELTHDEYETFLNDNHIQGAVKSKIRLGLFYNNELVQCIGISKSRFKKGEMELLRMCSKMNVQVIGGFSRLIKNACELYNIKVIYSYIDRRLFNGKGYNNIGFISEKISKPSYFYVKRLKRENRIKYQKHKLSKILPIFNEKKTEIENMEENGYYRVFDCGTLKVKYEYEI